MRKPKQFTTGSPFNTARSMIKFLTLGKTPELGEFRSYLTRVNLNLQLQVWRPRKLWGNVNWDLSTASWAEQYWYVLGDSTGVGPQWLGLPSRFCHCPAGRPWANHFATLCLSFSISKSGLTRLPIFVQCLEIISRQ